MKKGQEIKVDIENGPVFFADEVGLVHNPVRMIIDFKSITPRIDVRNRDFQPLVIKHNVVMMDMFTAKNFLDVFKKNISNYEKKFGKIKMPDQLKKFEKENKKTKRSPDKKEMPSYFG